MITKFGCEKGCKVKLGSFTKFKPVSSQPIGKPVRRFESHGVLRLDVDDDWDHVDALVDRPGFHCMQPECRQRHQRKASTFVGMLQQMSIERLQPFDGRPRSFRTFTSIGTTCFAVVSMSIGTFHCKRPVFEKISTEKTFQMAPSHKF